MTDFIQFGLTAAGFYIAFMLIWGLLGLVLVIAWGAFGGLYDLYKSGQEKETP